MDAGDPAQEPWLDCFCNDCMHVGSGETDVAPWDKPKLSVVAVYPRYDYVPTWGASDRDRHTEKVVHDYMVRVGKLPKPLPHIKCKKECKALKLSLGSPKEVTVEPATGFVGCDDAMTTLAKTALCSSELIVVLRGHGAGSGSLVMSDGTKMGPAEVRKALERAGFHGRVLCLFDMCVADVAAPSASNASSASSASNALDAPRGWDDALYEWATLRSCCTSERQSSEHGIAVMDAVRTLVTGGLPRGELTQARVDAAWDVVRATRGDAADLAAWRVAPQLTLSRGWGSRGVLGGS